MKSTQRITFKVNGSYQDRHQAEWFFGTDFVRDLVRKTKRICRKTGSAELKVFQKGTGFLTITIC